MRNDVALLNDLNWGYRSSRVLHIANDLGLFTILSEKPLPCEQICKKIDSLVPALFNIMMGAYSKKEIFKLLEENRFARPKLVAERENIGSTWLITEKT